MLAKEELHQLSSPLASVILFKPSKILLYGPSIVYLPVPLGQRRIYWKAMMVSVVLQSSIY